MDRFWEKRSSVGREAIFTDPEKLRQAAYEYFEWANDNPLIEVDYVGKDATPVERAKPQAMTWAGLCIFLGVNTNYFRQFKATLEKSNEAQKEAFSLVITHIEDIIRTQKFSAAAAGLLNANIISRDLGLADAVKNEHTGANGGPIQTQQITGFEIKWS